MAKHKSTFPFKFKHNLDIDITFSAELDLPENPHAGKPRNYFLQQSKVLAQDPVHGRCWAVRGLVQH